MVRPLTSRIESALLWVAAFSYATGVFFCATLALSVVPPTKPVAVGLVTVLRYAKSRDYIAAAMFFVLVPALTILFRRWGGALLDREQRLLAWRHRSRTDFGLTALFTVPFWLAPFFYLTTGKIGWVLLLPVAIAYAGTRIRAHAVGTFWLRHMFRRELHPYHGLLFAEALSWIIFHDIVNGHRFAHFPTLFLEAVFVTLFVALFWAAALLMTRLVELNVGGDRDELFRRITTGAIPLVALPIAGLIWVPTPHVRAIVFIALCIASLLIMRVRALPPRAAWITAACVLMPLLVFVVSYACSADLAQWVDLFHRGESIGPASDYLRGKAPYRDVFALHGMLQDGLLDAWLMKVFGRSLEVAVARDAIVGGFLGVSIWYLGIALFQSIPLAGAVLAAGVLTTAENDRTFFQVVAVTLFWVALHRRSRTSAVLSGMVSAVALFFSYEIGMYSITGAVAVALILWVVSKRVQWTGLHPLYALLLFLAGAAAGAAPFVIYLLSRGALGEFANTSWLVIPRIIDAAWSLPFPDLVSIFRHDLSLRTIADFVIQEKFHLILTPLTVAVAAVYYIQRVIRRNAGVLDHALMVLSVFAAIAQRTAFGRAEFRHQYFAAYLTGPLLVLLAIFIVRNLRESWDERDEGTRAFIAALIVAALPLLGTLLWVPDLINWRIEDLINYQRRVLRIQRDPLAEEVQARIDEVRYHVNDLSPGRSSIFDFSNQPAFYFFLDRPNPTRFYQVPILSPREFQRETILALERAKPPLVIRRSAQDFDAFDGIDNTIRAQAVAAYIDDHYAYARTVRGVELWKRNSASAPLNVNAYLRKIRVPTIKQLGVLGARSRLLFPSVGSTPGANGSYWRSDLILHNPFKEPADLALRYVAGDTRIDRHLTLAAGRSLRIEDVIKTLFRAPDSVGVLWIEFRGERGPVARVKTYDTTRDASASIETPLSVHDGATAGSDWDQLSIVGIPGGGTVARRVSIGVVNVGMIPATFRIAVYTSDGRQIGKPVELGLPETELFHLTNAEAELGVPIDENMTVRVTMIAGTCVGFASVVDADGDNQLIPAVPSPKP